MKGVIITIPVMGEITLKEVTSPNLLSDLQKIVGGHIEAVPYFDKFMWEKKKQSCVAFCNEEGKLLDLPINHRATFFWLNAKSAPIDDVLVGDIAIVLGDEEFMKRI